MRFERLMSGLIAVQRSRAGSATVADVAIRTHQPRIDCRSAGYRVKHTHVSCMKVETNLAARACRSVELASRVPAQKGTSVGPTSCLSRRYGAKGPTLSRDSTRHYFRCNMEGCTARKVIEISHIDNSSTVQSISTHHHPPPPTDIRGNKQRKPRTWAAVRTHLMPASSMSADAFELFIASS